MIGRILITSALIASSLSPAAAAPSKLRAGAARIDVTPAPDNIPNPVHDPLFVRALVLESGKDKLALVSIDALVILKGEELVDSIAAELKIPRENVMISATHDHSAPFLAVPGNPAYLEQMKSASLEAVRKAATKLQPARIGYRTGKAYVNVNRDQKLGNEFVNGVNPEGPSDKTVAVMTVTDSAGKPIAIYANYAVHAVVMFFSKSRDGQIEISGDLSGATSQLIEERLGNDVVALWTSGAAGDQNPLFTAVRFSKERGFEDYGAGGWTLLDAQTRRLGDEILRVVAETTDLSDSAAFAVRTTTLTCPGQKPVSLGAPPEPGSTPWSSSRNAMTDGDPVKIPLTLMTIGDIALAGVGGELYTEIGMAVKAQSPYERTMVVTHLPGSVGYIPTDRAFAMPTEKARTASMKPGCADAGIPGSFKAMGEELARQSMPKEKQAKAR